MQDFLLKPHGPLSELAIAQGKTTFLALAHYLHQLPYRRPQTSGVGAVLAEACGTCSTKHGLLKAIADEHGRKDVDLMLCFFLMHADNTPACKAVFEAGPLSQFPEAHCYINYQGMPLDITSASIHVQTIASDIIASELLSLT